MGKLCNDTTLSWHSKNKNIFEVQISTTVVHLFYKNSYLGDHLYCSSLQQRTKFNVSIIFSIAGDCKPLPSTVAYLCNRYFFLICVLQKQIRVQAEFLRSDYEIASVEIIEIKKIMLFQYTIPLRRGELNYVHVIEKENSVISSSLPITPVSLYSQKRKAMREWLQEDKSELSTRFQSRRMLEYQKLLHFNVIFFESWKELHLLFFSAFQKGNSN